MKENDPHIDQELQESPILQSLKGEKSPFQLPEGYFEGFAARLKEAQAEEELIAQQPGLQSIANETVFQAPAGYFEDFPQRLKQKIEEVEPARARKISLKRYAWPLGLAASVALLLGLGLWQQNRVQAVSNPFVGFSEVEILDVFELQDLETEDLLAMLGEEDLVDVDLYGELNESEMESLLEEIDPGELLDDWKWD